MLIKKKRILTGSGGTYLKPSTLEVEASRWIIVSSRPAMSTKLVTGQAPKLHRENIY